MKKKIILPIAILIIAIIAIAGQFFYKSHFAITVVKSGKLYIPSNPTYEQVLDSLKPFVKDIAAFDKYAKSKNYPSRIYDGRYTIAKGMSARNLLDLLRSGKEDEIDIRIGNYASIIEMADRIAPFLEATPEDILEGIMTADFTQGVDTANALAFFIPNTYKFTWNTNGKEFAKKMKGEYDKFWNENRLNRAKEMNMSPMDITTLASIVQLESTIAEEQPKVAALYLNRLRIGMKLDADPTVIYIKKQQTGFKTKISRVYYKDLKIESPYNTYRTKGLPPSPICMPNPNTIDAVLNHETHDYIYFVANPEKPGYHWFAKTLQEQEKNAAIYRAWLDKNNIK